MMDTVNPCGTALYDGLWGSDWGDQQRYGPVSRHQRRLMAELFAGLKVESVLDVGCGNGTNLKIANACLFPKQMYGVDVSAKAIAAAKRGLAGAEFFAGRLDSVKAEITADLVMSVDVLEHVVDDVGLLKEMVARANRYVLNVSVQGVMRPSEKQIGHVRNYRPGELAAKMLEAGAVPIKQLCWGFPFYSPLFRSFVECSGMSNVSLGKYGRGKRLLCTLLYYVFRLNSARRGDKVFVLGRVS